MKTLLSAALLVAFVATTAVAQQGTAKATEKKMDKKGEMMEKKGDKMEKAGDQLRTGLHFDPAMESQT